MNAGVLDLASPNSRLEDFARAGSLPTRFGRKTGSRASSDLGERKVRISSVLLKLGWPTPHRRAGSVTNPTKGGRDVAEGTMWRASQTVDHNSSETLLDDWRTTASPRTATVSPGDGRLRERSVGHARPRARPRRQHRRGRCARRGPRLDPGVARRSPYRPGRSRRARAVSGPSGLSGDSRIEGRDPDPREDGRGAAATPSPEVRRPALRRSDAKRTFPVVVVSIGCPLHNGRRSRPLGKEARAHGHLEAVARSEAHHRRHGRVSHRLDLQLAGSRHQRHRVRRPQHVARVGRPRRTARDSSAGVGGDPAREHQRRHAGHAGR